MTQDNKVLREALQFYADQQHFVLHEDVFDTISGEPQNWQEDESNTIMFEDGTVAKQALDATASIEPEVAIATVITAEFNNLLYSVGRMFRSGSAEQLIEAGDVLVAHINAHCAQQVAVWRERAECAITELASQMDIRAAVEAQLAARIEPAEPVRTTLKPQPEDDGRVLQWWFDCDGHYIDVAKDEQGKYSILFRDRSDRSEGWLDQADQIAQPAPSIPEGWQPIETAQKNMVPRLYLIGRYCVQGFVDATGELMAQSDVSPHWRKMRGHPSHWMPLPAAPKQNDGGA